MYDVVIIGGGPGGYAAALYAHNFGLSVALIEKDRVGGTCLLRGCIPAKAWLQTAEVFSQVKRAGEFGVQTSEPSLDWSAALARKQSVVEGLVNGLSGLLKTRGVDVIDGFGRIENGGVVVDTAEGAKTIEAKNIILATGSVPRTIPGYERQDTRIVTSDEALDWESQPQRVAIIGAGAIGCEFASLLGDFGSEVHLFEVADQVVPGLEPEAAKVLERALKKKKIKVYTGTGVGSPEMIDGGVRVAYGDKSVDVDVVLVAVGRAPVTDNLGLDGTSVEVDRGFVKVDPATMQTAQPGIYAVGDIVAGAPQLAHAGFAEGISAITHIATGETAAVDYRAIPLVVYTHPEVASVGLTEAQATAAGMDVTTTDHGMRGVGRAIIQGETGGVVKIVSEVDGPIIGATVAGPGAGEMIHELMYAVAWEALPAEAAAFIHAHPTVSEAIGETLLAAAGRPLH
ncbi:MAG: dihydrolipoyl dehydrogenase [Acidimicrobiia bacterium]|nr:dihydrolipoyl dehydrogenase [Acidimicrobiia bacterium]NNF63754.1 dihydrolipoyl dehydrogenase [Acidimicrobiia bacterium]